MKAAAELPPAGLADAPPHVSGGWSRRRWLTFIVLIFALHLALLFLFGARKPVVPRAVTDVPALKLATDSSEWLALNDPTLFVLPHRRDFAAIIPMPTTAGEKPSFRWTEPARWLSLPDESLGLVFHQFIQTNRFPDFELPIKPPLKLSAPAVPIEPVLAQNSTLRVEGELARRRLSAPANLTNWPYASVIAPSKVQVLVDPAGNVVSAVLLPPDPGYSGADQYDLADQRALELARAMRFTPSPHLTIGRMIFNWHTVPPPPGESEPPPNP